MNKPNVAFICVHNSCRSQIAEALSKHFARDVLKAILQELKLNHKLIKDAVRLIKKIYDIDMEKTQYSKLITDLPEIDIVIKMGCNVICPFFPSKYEEDWGLDDPTGKSDEEFEIVIAEIERRLKNLLIRFQLKSYIRIEYAIGITFQFRKYN